MEQLNDSDLQEVGEERNFTIRHDGEIQEIEMRVENRDGSLLNSTHNALNQHIVVIQNDDQLQLPPLVEVLIVPNGDLSSSPPLMENGAELWFQPENVRTAIKLEPNEDIGNIEGTEVAQTNSPQMNHLEKKAGEDKRGGLRPRRKAPLTPKKLDLKCDEKGVKGQSPPIPPPEDPEEEEDEVESSDEPNDEVPDKRRCIVCCRERKFTEDIFDQSNQLHYHIDILIAHINLPSIGKMVKGNGTNCGICPDCMNQLQRWHIFNSAVVKRHELVDSSGIKCVNDPLSYDTIESRVYRNYKKMAKVKEVYLNATHHHFTRRHLTEKDWDFFCDHLFHSNSVKSEKSKELERFLTSKEKLSQMYCIKCQKCVSGGKKGYTKHVETEHQESPVFYPCDICGTQYPEKDMTASTEDYYPHWISHFYFNKCEDCGKRFPTKRALGQHRHAVHKNRQVKCEKCGKVLANKMSLDLHLLRHLPETEKKKYMIKCKICKKKIAQWNLKSHLATHNDERPWKCDHCEATFKMKGALVSHRDVVHFNLKNHVCSICGEAFKSASSLRGHVRRHEGRKDYKCEVCHKEYYTYSALKGHKVVHQTARDFICEVCGKAFKKKKALEEHGTIHTGEKPHRCPICGREIRVKSNLYKHMKIHKRKPGEPSTASRKRTTSGPSSPPQEIRVVSAPTTVLEVEELGGEVNLEGSGFTYTAPGPIIHTMSLEHQHQDLLAVPASGHFYAASHYFTATLDHHINTLNS